MFFVTQSRGSIDPGQGGLYKYDQGPIFPSMTPALRQTCLFWRQKYVAHEISVEMVHMEKSRPSKNAQIYLKTTLPYNENGYFLPANCLGIRSLMKC